ncbi:MAG: DUF354 domain-containing protein [Bacteroidales bacterium]|nr:DUF354 domain-containing protein [Bacteroidales bacterium]MCF8405797.1 DUF354 domain-containing protein [Bacteroidales bacterium]
MENKNLNIAFYITHPSHVYLWMSIAKRIKSHHIYFISKPKDNLLDILNSFNVDYKIIGRHHNSLAMKVFYILKQLFYLGSFLKKQKIDLCIGMYSFDLAISSKFTKSKCLIVYSDNKHRWKGNKVEELFCNFFADFISCPKGDQKLNKRADFCFNGVVPLIYLHPEYFKPKFQALKKYNITIPYVIIKEKLGSSLHDKLSSKKLNIEKIINEISKYVNSIILIAPKQYYHPIVRSISGSADIHDLLYFSDLFIGDSGIMAFESSILGVPTIRYSDMIINIENDLAEYGIIENYTDIDQLLLRTKQILTDNKYKQISKNKSIKYIKSTGDTQNCILKGIFMIISFLEKDYS